MLTTIFMMLIPVLLMIGSIVLLVIFVFAHKKMAQAHVEISEHLKVIANKMKTD
jgi:hypothetical protein